MRDVQDAGAAALDLAHHVQQPLDLVVGQHGRRLVENQHALAAVPALEGAGDRHDGALNRRRLGERPVDVEVDLEALEDAMGLALLLAPADPSGEAADEVTAQREVVHRAELEDQTEVLVDETKPVRDRVAKREFVTGELGDRAGVRGVVAGQRFDQRRLPGAVLTDERVNLARPDLDRSIDQRPSARERLRQVLDPKRRCVFAEAR